MNNEVKTTGTDFYFHQLRHERGISGFYNDNPYHLEPNMLAHDLIHIFLRISEYSTADYLITKEKTANAVNFYIRYFEQYFVDDDFYLLANHQLSPDEIQLLTLNDMICKRFFETF